MSSVLPAPVHRLACLALALSACGLLGDAGDGETEATGVAASDATGVPTTGTPPGCSLDPSDCPGPLPCEQVDCVDQQCRYTPIAADERDDDIAGDCRVLVCDGAGGGSPVDDATDVPDDVLVFGDGMLLTNYYGVSVSRGRRNSLTAYSIPSRSITS